VKSSRGWAPLLFLAVAIAMFPRAALGLGTFFHYDTWMQNLTFRAWWFEQLRAGHFATWCPGMFAGYPLFAETQTGPLYPPTFALFSLLPATLAFSWSVVLHFAFAGWGMWLVLRRAGVGVAGALLAGLVFELSGFLVTHVVHFNLLTGAAWTPWVALGAMGVARGSARSAMFLAVAIAMLLLGAHPYATLMNLLLAAAVSLALPDRPRTALRRSVPFLGGAVLLGAGIAAVQVLPTRAFLPRTPRGEGVDWSFLTFGSFPPWHVATLAAPDVYGTPVTATYWAGPDWSHYAETCAFVGLLTLGLAVVALVLRRDRFTTTLVALASVSFLLMLGRYTPVYRILTMIPLLESTRLPARFALPFTFAVAALAGLGLDALRTASAADRRRAIVLGVATMVVLSAAAAWEGRVARDPSPDLLQVGRTWSAWVLGIVEQAKATFTRLGVETAGSCLVLLLALVAAARRFVPGAALAVVGLSLFTWGRTFNPTLNVDALKAPPPAVGALPASSPRPRIFRQGVDEQWSRLPGQPRVDLMTPGWSGNEAGYRTGAWALPPNSQLLYGVDSGEGFTSLPPRQWLEWMGAPAQAGATPRPDLSEAQADLLSLDAVISTGAGIGGETWDTVSLPGDVWVSRNLDPLPRVRLARSWITIPSRDALLERIRSAAHDPREAVLLESAPQPGVERRSAGPVDAALPARETAPGRWEIDVPAGADGLVVVSESFDPDWKATGPGGGIPVLRADGLFLGFVAPDEGGTIVLRHAPASVRNGAVLSVAALLLFVALSFAVRRGRDPEPAPDSHRPIPRFLPLGLVAAAVAVSLVSRLGDVGNASRDRADSSLAAAAARSWSDEARAANAAGAREAARDLLLRAEAVRPDDPSLPYRRGLVERAAGNLPAARAAFQRALEIDPSHGPARSALAES
jgi:hypothetical protein